MKKTELKKMILGAVVAMLLIFFHWFGWLTAPEQTLRKFFLPAQSRFYQWGRELNRLVNYRVLIKENERLKEEAAKLSLDYLKLHSLLVENEYLRKELNFLQSQEFSYQLAAVVGALPLNDQILVINQGAAAGLSEGLPATFNQGVIVGKIIKVEADRAYVALLTDVKSQLAVMIGEQASSNGLLKGQAGNSLLVDLIPQDQDIKTDDLVTTSGLEEKIPRGLLVGRVKQVDNIIGQIFKQARISPPFSYQNLPILSIIKTF